MNLKETLMILGNRLVAERGFDPATGQNSPISLNAKLEGTTVAIARFTSWLNETEEARELLAEMGVDWPVVNPEPTEGNGDFPLREVFHANFQGTETEFEVIGVAGQYLKCQGNMKTQGGSQVISMLIGVQHVRETERKRFREALARLGGAVAGKDLATSCGGGRTEAGRIGGEQDA